MVMSTSASLRSETLQTQVQRATVAPDSAVIWVLCAEMWMGRAVNVEAQGLVVAQPLQTRGIALLVPSQPRARYGF